MSVLTGRTRSLQPFLVTASGESLQRDRVAQKGLGWPSKITSKGADTRYDAVWQKAG